MGFEYRARLGAGALRDLTALPEATDLRDLVAVVTADPGELRLRLTALPYRPDWPEDVTLTRMESTLLVTIHGAPGNLRSQLLAAIRKAIHDQHRQDVEFEEL
jgi:hypothetical protein